jgi:hypothetical protein
MSMLGNLLSWLKSKEQYHRAGDGDVVIPALFVNSRNK